VFTVDVDDITETAADTDQTVDLLSLVEGDVVVGDEVRVDIITAAAGLTAFNVSVGVTGAVTQLTANTSVLTGKGFDGADGANYSVPSGGKSLLVNLDPAANGEDLSDATAFEIRVWATISRLADRVKPLF